MGCDIHSHAERRNADGQWEYLPDLRPFDWRSYGLFGWLADVRNYSAIEPIAKGRGVPENASATVHERREWDDDCHSSSWVAMDELLSFNYDALCEDRRCSRQIGPNSFTGGATCPAGDGQVQTYREFLGEEYFEELERLKTAGVERIIFWFDN